MKSLPSHYRSQWILSADIGQAIDPTAIAIVEYRARAAVRRDVVVAADAIRDGQVVEIDSFDAHANERFDAYQPASINVRHLERLPLRTPYPDVVAHIAGILRRPPLDLPRAKLLLDMTGVGRPIVDMFVRAALAPVGVMITSGDQERRVHEHEWRVSKSLLVSNLQASLHSGELRIAKGLPEARTLASELQSFRTTITESGNQRFGAREGAHDDLVLAVAMGVWWARRKRERGMVVGHFVISG